MLLNRLKKKPFCNNTHLFLFSIILLLLGLKYKFILIFLALYLIFITIKFKELIIPSFIILILIIGEVFLINLVKEPKTFIKAKISEVEVNGYVIDYSFYKIKVIDYDSKYKPGDILELELNYEEIKGKSYDTDFDYKEYLKSKRILFLAKAKESTKIKSGFSLNLLKYYYESYLESKLDPNTFSYVKAIVFSDNDLNKDLKNGYSILGISHILAISGLHIIILFSFLSFVFKKVFRYYKKTIPLIIISIYVISIGLPLSALRALLFLIIGALNEKGEIKYTRLDIFSISFFLMIITWPFVFYNSGFILSFLVSFVLLFIGEFINTKSKLLNLYLTYLVIYFVTLPIISNFNNQISILALLISPILSFILSYIIIPLSYLITVVPELDLIFSYVFKFINLYILNMSLLNIKIPIKSFNIYMMIIYYLALVLLIKSIILNKNVIKYFIVFQVTLLSIIFIRFTNPFTKITYIDVGQGDSILIELSFGRGNVLIDAYNSFDYIKSEGLYSIDYLVLTHGDNDHINQAEDIINYFKIKNIILNVGEYNEAELNIINLANNKRINYTNNVDYFKLSNYQFNVLNTGLYDNENDNSIVIYVNIDGVDLLFMGDASSKKEHDIIDKYKIKKIDVLKVGHHGSNTSTSTEFISYINPKIAIISVGKNNKYGHPNKEALDNLCNSKIYMTKDLGNINVLIFNNKYFVK